MTKHYAVCYPSQTLQNINSALSVKECTDVTEVLSVIEEWREKLPGKRYVYRREVVIEPDRQPETS